ncbi:alpha-ribazole phosphatase [Novosphingobium sp. CF614]|uniref:histidine phosphatase family protein n=1 Tax=Novosphingobium sp. CF614 TaxID=1884364 RepID=UPI0008F1E9D7|nr:histidine phosphatase family protein [Novosphingobium sp. CF614]SFG24844.1 alpha-ribazole phosphatase [Novosphingobium sp. CF614]
MTGFIIHLLRHGPPLRSGLMLGHTDLPPLDARCLALSARVRSLAVERIVTSDLSRAAHSGEYLARETRLPLRRDPRWRELDFGAWDGLAPEALDKGALSRFWADPDANPPPDGESWTGLRARIAEALADLTGPVLVVTHAGAMRAALSVLTGLDHRGVWALDLPYHALLSLRVWPGSPMTGQVVGLAAGAPG